MSLQFNQSIVAGHMARDPEVRTIGERAVASFSVASNRHWIGGDGQPKEEVVFVECTAWGRTAEFVGKFFTKGAPIHVDGYLRMETWKDKKTAENRSRLILVVERASFVESKREATKASGGAVRRG